jgi:transposase
MRKIREVLRLKHEGRRTNREIAEALGLGSASVSRYVNAAESVGLSWPLPEELDDAILEAKLFPPVVDATPARPLPSFVDLHQELKRPGVTLQLLWEEYVQSHGEGAYRYSQFCEHYRRWEKKLSPTMRQQHRVGEKTFIDYAGQKPHVTDPRTGQVTEVELFVAVLGASSYTFGEATWSQELPSWIASHERMLEFFGGSTEIWVPDNLKSGITTPCRYEPGINRTYEEFARHYGAVVIPTRVRKPRDKAKVEVGVQLAERWLLAPLRNRTFFSLAELNDAIRERLRELNSRPMRILGLSRRELYERLDRPALKPLPANRCELATWKVDCGVNIDYHVEVEDNFYSVHSSLANERVETRVTAAVVEIHFKGKRIESHPRLRGRGQYSTKPEHMPSSHRAHAKWTPSRLIAWAEKTGPATGRVVTEILKSRPHPEQGFRACLGVLSLGKRFGAERVEAACLRAERLGSYRYRTIDNILRKKLDQLPFEEEPAAGAPRPDHDNIRGAQYYAEKETKC